MILAEFAERGALDPSVAEKLFTWQTLASDRGGAYLPLPEANSVGALDPSLRGRLRPPVTPVFTSNPLLYTRLSLQRASLPPPTSGAPLPGSCTSSCVLPDPLTPGLLGVFHLCRGRPQPSHWEEFAKEDGTLGNEVRRLGRWPSLRSQRGLAGERPHHQSSGRESRFFGAHS